MFTKIRKLLKTIVKVFSKKQTIKLDLTAIQKCVLHVLGFFNGINYSSYSTKSNEHAIFEIIRRITNLNLHDGIELLWTQVWSIHFQRKPIACSINFHHHFLLTWTFRDSQWKIDYQSWQQEKQKVYWIVIAGIVW